MRAHSFKHGVHPHDHKSLSASSSIEDMPLPGEVYIPLQQHIGRPCSPLVEKKDAVKSGQLIGKPEGFVSSGVHSSVTGTVKAIGLFMNSMGTRIPMVHIVRDESVEDDWQLIDAPEDWRSESAEALLKIISEAGIVGMGGAAFPSHVKLKVSPEKPIDVLIVNGCECEPYLTCDHRGMLEQTDELLEGMAILMKVLGVEKGYVGIENNKKDAIQVVTDQLKTKKMNAEVIPLKTKYPQGAEKMLIKAVIKRTVPAGGLPGDVGVIVHNVGTTVAVKEAVVDGKPLVNRVMTVTGDAINNPKNIRTRIGTPLKEIIAYCGGLSDVTAQVILGGPMMGFNQSNLDVPVVKATSGVVCTNQIKETKRKKYACVRCNSCVGACPVFLLPNRLSRLVEIGEYDDAERLGVLNCIECGSCVFVCPSGIPILQWLRVGKFRVNEIKRKAAV